MLPFRPMPNDNEQTATIGAEQEKIDNKTLRERVQQLENQVECLEECLDDLSESSEASYEHEKLNVTKGAFDEFVKAPKSTDATKHEQEIEKMCKKQLEQDAKIEELEEKVRRLKSEKAYAEFGRKTALETIDVNKAEFYEDLEEISADNIKLRRTLVKERAQRGQALETIEDDEDIFDADPEDLGDDNIEKN